MSERQQVTAVRALMTPMVAVQRIDRQPTKHQRTDGQRQNEEKFSPTHV
jgi:hypothetical protein